VHMERRTKDLPIAVLLIIAPTRVFFESTFIKKRVEINLWSWIFLAINVLFLFVCTRLEKHLGFWHGLFILVWLLPISRVFEIGYAFYNDSLDQMDGWRPRSGLSRIQRFKLLGRSYVEVAVCYASLYLMLPGNSFGTPPRTAFESLYFSWITITT